MNILSAYTLAFAFSELLKINANEHNLYLAHTKLLTQFPMKLILLHYVQHLF